jgi:hypothetical protein
MGIALLWLAVIGVIVWRKPDELAGAVAFWAAASAVIAFFATIGWLAERNEKITPPPSESAKTAKPAARDR